MFLKIFKKKQPAQPIEPPKPPLKDNLVFAFKDLDGINYYRFNDPADMPMSRVGPMLTFDIELIKGITKENLNELLELCEKHLFDAAKDRTALPKAAAVIHEIKLRQNQISNTNLYFNWFAVNYIREDEDPKVYSIEAQKQKVAAFKKGSTQEGSFFFALPEYSTLLKRLNILTENWEGIMTLSDMARQRNQEALEILK